MNTNNYLGVVIPAGLAAFLVYSSGNISMFIDFPAAIVIILGTTGSYFLVENSEHKDGNQLLAAGHGAWMTGLITCIISIILVLANLETPQRIGPHLALGLISLLYGNGIYMICRLLSLRNT